MTIVLSNASNMVLTSASGGNLNGSPVRLEGGSVQGIAATLDTYSEFQLKTCFIVKRTLKNALDPIPTDPIKKKSRA